MAVTETLRCRQAPLLGRCLGPLADAPGNLIARPHSGQRTAATACPSSGSCPSYSGNDARAQPKVTHKVTWFWHGPVVGCQKLRIVPWPASDAAACGLVALALALGLSSMRAPHCRKESHYLLFSKASKPDSYYHRFIPLINDPESSDFPPRDPLTALLCTLKPSSSCYLKTSPA